MLATLLMAAEEGAEPSKTPFYILAGCLIVFAALLAAVGTARHETFPPSRGVASALMLVCALLVAGTMFTAVITA
jgi:drug/metabolite transporter (DMT)-like permease